MSVPSWQFAKTVVLSTIGAVSSSNVAFHNLESWIWNSSLINPLIILYIICHMIKRKKKRLLRNGVATVLQLIEFGLTVTNTATINHATPVIHAHRYPRRAINYCLLTVSPAFSCLRICLIYFPLNSRYKNSILNDAVLRDSAYYLYYH